MYYRFDTVACLLALVGTVGIGSSAAATSDPPPTHDLDSLVTPSPLLAIDRNRDTVVERVVSQWGDALAQANAGVTPAQLREMLMAMRADQLLAASLAGNLEGLRNVVSSSLLPEAAVKPSLLRSKALGDADKDVVYVPVTPCRLVETRGTFAAVYQGGGPFASNEVRSYALQGGNGVCLTQLPPSVTPSAVQLQVYGIPNTGGSGDIEVLPQGAAFGTTATLVYLGSNAFTSSAATSLVNLANKQIGVQVRGAGAHVAIDVVGFFRPASGGFVSSVTAGTGLTITGGGHGAVNLAVNTATIQARVSGTCATGSSIRSINADGTVACELDDVGTGTVTSVATGPGLVGSPITTNGTISLASTQLLPVNPCPPGFEPRWSGINWDCADPSVFASNIQLPNSTGPSAGNILKGGTRFIHDYGGTFVGAAAGNFSMVIGGGNTGIGQAALFSNVSGTQNAAIGEGALTYNTTGSGNTAVGSGGAMTFNSTGSFNTAVGSSALLSNTTATFNTAVGASTLNNNTIGENNTGVGAMALGLNSTGSRNTAVGTAAMNQTTSGSSNSALGTYALYLNATGSANTAMGFNALASNVAGGGNAAFGQSALRWAVNSGNTAIGDSALANLTAGSSNLVLGASAGVALFGGNDNIYLMNQGPGGTESQTIRIGTANHTRAYLSGVFGATIGPGAPVVVDSTGQLGTIMSSRRFKENIADMDAASSGLMQLRPVTFNYRSDAAHRLQYGLIAEEVADIYPGLVVRSADGRITTVMYQFLAPMLLNELQKQQRTMVELASRHERQRDEIAALEVAYLREIADLKRAVEVLMARTAPEAMAAAR